MQFERNAAGIYLQNQDFIVPKGKVLLQLQDVRTGKIREGLFDNMVLTAGKNSMADALRGTTANNKGIITYCALGTSPVAPALGDTGLTAELFRKQISVREVANNVATFSTFFTTAEAIGTLREAALFGDDASSTPGSGTPFCKVAINRVKTANDTLTAVWSVTIG